MSPSLNSTTATTTTPVSSVRGETVSGGPSPHRARSVHPTAARTARAVSAVGHVRFNRNSMTAPPPGGPLAAVSFERFLHLRRTLLHERDLVAELRPVLRRRV